MARRTIVEVTPAQRDFLRALAYQSDRTMKAVLDDALLLLEAAINHSPESLSECVGRISNHYTQQQGVH